MVGPLNKNAFDLTMKTIVQQAADEEDLNSTTQHF
jgi:hypothetical protein